MDAYAIGWTVLALMSYTLAVGMSYDVYLDKYQDKFAILGGFVYSPPLIW